MKIFNKFIAERWASPNTRSLWVQTKNYLVENDWVSASKKNERQKYIWFTISFIIWEWNWKKTRQEDSSTENEDSESLKDDTLNNCNDSFDLNTIDNEIDDDKIETIDDNLESNSNFPKTD